MPVYFLDIEAEPTAAATESNDVAGASVLTFVVASSPEAAETAARAAIIDRAWLVKGVSSLLQPTDEQISRLDTDIKAIYRQALRHGIGQFFLAHPKAPGHPDDQIQVRSLGSPVIDDTTPH